MGAAWISLGDIVIDGAPHTIWARGAADVDSYQAQYEATRAHYYPHYQGPPPSGLAALRAYNPCARKMTLQAPAPDHLPLPPSPSNGRKKTKPASETVS